METFVWIIGATLAGGVVSMVAAAFVALVLLERWAPRMVGFSVGVLLAVALLELLPRAADELGMQLVGAWLLAGIVAFFVLEKLAIWRHAHAHGHGQAHDHAAGAGGASAAMILVGDGVHNAVDGVLIAAAFLQDTTLGIATTVAVVAHEIPQEVGDFAVLVAGGMSRRRALALNALSSLGAVAGGIAGYFLLAMLEQAVPYALVVAAASFIYIAVADLVPRLHRGHDDFRAPAQVAFIACGILAVAVGLALH